MSHFYVGFMARRLQQYRMSFFPYRAKSNTDAVALETLLSKTPGQKLLRAKE